MGLTLISFQGELNSGSDRFDFYGQPQYGAISKLTPYQLRTFQIGQPFKDESGITYDAFFLVSRNKDYPTFLGMKFQTDENKRVVRLVMMEFSMQRMRNQFRTDDLTKLSRSNLTKLRRNAEVFNIDLNAKDKNEVRQFTMQQTQKLRSFFSRVESNTLTVVENPVVEPIVAEKPSGSHQPSTKNDSQLSENPPENTQQVTPPPVPEKTDPVHQITIERSSEASQETTTIKEQQQINNQPMPLSPPPKPRNEVEAGKWTFTKTFISFGLIAFLGYLVAWGVVFANMMSNLKVFSWFKLSAGQIGSIGLVLLIACVALIPLANIVDYWVGWDRRNSFLWRWPKVLHHGY